MKKITVSLAMRDVPQVINLFAGGGGFSLGATRAGFNLAASVEIDPFANETHGRNFPNTCHLGLDAAGLTGSELLSKAGLRKGELAGLIGGPPCQGFSSIGRRNPEDSRNSLFAHFMRLASETKPAFFVAENVPGILDERNKELIAAALKMLPKNYRLLPPTKVRASDFGAPTTRTRVFFIGYDPAKCSDLANEVFVAPESKTPTSVGMALAGLPVEIDPEWQSDDQAWRPVKKMGGDSFFYSKAQGELPEGLGDSFAIDAFFEHGYTSGCFGTRHAGVIAERYGRLKAKEMDRISKSVRLDANGLCPTLRAGTGSDKGSYQAVRPIHPTQARVITPREAARLQGFPDWFALHGTKWHSFRQLGNSVSPIVAEAVLRGICKSLR
jgi:DNA (cytosine-5)-methyltransferase 1